MLYRSTKLPDLLQIRTNALYSESSGCIIRPPDRGKAVDNLPFGWYNYTRRQEYDGKTPAHGGLAQLGERLHGMQEVSGSIPLFSTNQEQNEHEVTIQMVGNVFVLFCELPCVTTS